MIRNDSTPIVHQAALPGRPPAYSARSIALEVLRKVERDNVFADDALDRVCERTKLESRDRALAVELIYGVLRHRSTLDWRLSQVIDRPLQRLPTVIRTILRLGAYQLLYLERVPPSAAVNEAVTLAKRLAGQHWSGFVNAILRALLRRPTPSWPDPTTDPILSYAVQYGCPEWLVNRWISRFGTQKARFLCNATLAIPPLTIRANTLRTDRDRLQTALAAAGYAAHPTEISPVGLTIEKQGPVPHLPLFREGAFYVEDEAGQLVAPLLDPQPGERVLDACAAPGGKATHVAALMQNRGEIVALDRDPRRLQLLRENCRRLGIEILTAIQADVACDFRTISKSRFASSPLLEVVSRPFDRILLDAPCSGLGVLRRHPEGRWQKTERLFSQYHDAQIALLTQVSRALRPGGVLVYSTCSTESEENEQVIAEFLQRHADFSRESVEPWLPPTGRFLVTVGGDLSTMFSPSPMDGFFAARLRKASG